MAVNIEKLVLEAKKALISPSSIVQFEEIVARLAAVLRSDDAMRIQFYDKHYEKLISFLLEKLNSEWLMQFPQGTVVTCFDVFFIEGCPHSALLLLNQAVQNSESNFKLRKCVALIETFLRQYQMQQLFLAQCDRSVAKSLGNMYYTDNRSPPPAMLSDLRDKLLTCIASLSEVIVGKMKGEVNELLFPANYVPLLVDEMLVVMEKIEKRLKSGTECSVVFLGQLIGKLCFVGYADILWQRLMPVMVKKFESSPAWRRIAERLLTAVHVTHLESVLVPLLKLSPSPRVVSTFIGHTINDNLKLEFLVCNKLILLRHFKEDCVLRNILGFLAHHLPTRDLYYKTFLYIIAAWSAPNSLKHTTHEQHVYVCKAILVCTGLLTDADKDMLREGLIEMLVSGVKHHLDSATPAVRHLGMVVGEAVTSAVAPEGQKLAFEYEKDEETEKLLSLLRPVPTTPSPQQQETVSSPSAVDDVTQKLAQTLSVNKYADTKPSDQLTAAAADLDSDDDLVPYDMSHDVKQVKTKPPVYIRDCLDGIISNENREIVEASLRSADKLVRACPVNSIVEVASEFVKVLLHLEDQWSIDDFTQLRYRTMLALAVCAPSQVSGYLTQEFYARNYNVRQRMDMLEVLAGAAQELSSIAVKPSHNLISVISSNGDNSDKSQNIESSSSNDWHKIIEQRLEAKTRRFGSKRSSAPTPAAAPNRFANHAGEFFFPLLRFADTSEPYVDLTGDNHILLTRLLYTLGIIMHSAANTLILTKMAKTFFEFTWIIRHHQEGAVRSAMLFAVCMFLLVVPSHVLLDDLQQDALELKAWLEDVLLKDTDVNCQKMAAQSLSLLQRLVTQENQT